ncbi:MAG: hypothetical protein CBB97_07200 [Candidatus Endolissoclinum sp. TMED37]|nr:MAG: hypothetical protein CBB97_07200 [Candidatus Endolissoclinum sp. TMED37]|tara:strand:+ start:551 stop:814 length:264 start_codon:yes stop_codon:yes gene_type:complete
MDDRTPKPGDLAKVYRYSADGRIQGHEVGVVLCLVASERSVYSRGINCQYVGDQALYEILINGIATIVQRNDFKLLIRDTTDANQEK